MASIIRSVYCSYCSFWQNGSSMEGRRAGISPSKNSIGEVIAKYSVLR